MSTTDAIRIVDGVELPGVGTWQVDPGHSDVAFLGRHLGLANVRGHFTGVEGTVEIADDIRRSRVDIQIDLASVQSGFEDRDESLRSERWFDVERHPSATFRSTAIAVDGSRGTLIGDLELKGITHEVTFDVAHLGHARDPWDDDRAAFRATTTITRAAWGLILPAGMEAMGALVSRTIVIEVETELIKA